MSHNRIPPNAVPDSFLETVTVMQDSDQGLRNIQTELNHAAALDGLDLRMRIELEYVRDALDPECRDAQDAKRDIPVPLLPSLVTTAYCAPAALRPCRFATSSQARSWLRSTPANG